MADVFTVSVSQINRRLSMLVKNDKALSDLYVRGEISNFTHHKPSGHFYFTLKDETSSIKCVMFSSYASKVNFPVQSGMKVIVHGGVNVYERDGANQIYASEIFPEGLGEMYLAFEQTKAELMAKGMFDRKRELPVLPRRVCIITSEKGAALQDMLNIISRRCPIMKVLIIPATVQGETAAGSLIDAVKAAQSTDCDLLIIGRGGGSAEDLSAFNDRELAEALFESRIPTISAVGHETDFTIADFVADRRAPTPSAAAEIATAVTTDDLIASVQEKCEAVRRRLFERIDNYQLKIDETERRITALSPIKRIESRERELELLYKKITAAVNVSISYNEALIDKTSSHISAINPMNILSRGYSVAKSDGDVIYSATDVSVGDSLEILLKDGVLKASVTDVSVSTDEN